MLISSNFTEFVFAQDEIGGGTKTTVKPCKNGTKYNATGGKVIKENVEYTTPVITYTGGTINDRAPEVMPAAAIQLGVRFLW